MTDNKNAWLHKSTDDDGAPLGWVPVAAKLSPHDEPLRTTGHRLTEIKVDSILERGYVHTGYVLANTEGERAIVELSAVRWVSNDDMWKFMHPENQPKPFATSDAMHGITGGVGLGLVGHSDKWFEQADRVDVVDYAKRLEQKVWELEQDNARVQQRYENSQGMANNFAMQRMEICDQLHRFGMFLVGSKVICKGPQTYVNPNTNAVHMIPILASGLEQTPILPFSNNLKPIIAWYRQVPEKVKQEDGSFKTEIREEYSHYEEAAMTAQDPRNRKNKKQVVDLPKTNIPPPRGGQTFSGNWVWKLTNRTDELCPKIINK